MRVQVPFRLCRGCSFLHFQQRPELRASLPCQVVVRRPDRVIRVEHEPAPDHHDMGIPPLAVDSRNAFVTVHRPPIPLLERDPEVTRSQH